MVVGVAKNVNCFFFSTSKDLGYFSVWFHSTPNQTIKGVCGLLIGIEEKDGATQLPPSPPRTILGHPN